ncbi:WEB family protein [Carex littledalei]|uniref:WEB family protein n=1 Tax=Carex littledalei TaxID=544730 RepID=A0A833RA22_9POAL|nr:WEB family protein [Carex littledalei]
MSEAETIRQFQSVKEAAAAFSKYDSTLAISSPSTPASRAGSGSGQKSTPVYYEVSVMDSIKRLEMELSKIKQELGLMRKRRSEMEIAMAGISAQFHRNLSKLAEIEAAKAAQRSAVREEKRWEDENEYWPCFGDALSIPDMDIGLERRMERKSQKKKPLVPLVGRIFSKKSSSDDIDYTYPESTYSVLS